MADDIFFILHGWGGNKPDHWQEHLHRKLVDAGKTVFYPKMPDPQEPCLDAWLTRVATEITTIRDAHPIEPLTVLAHSLGSITWMHFAASEGWKGRRAADRVLLVAPPYIVPQVPPIDVPETVPAFFPPPMHPRGIAESGRETVLIASDTDDYSTFDQSSGYALMLDIPIHKLPGAGHISPYYGYGEWPWVVEWSLRKADLPPKTNAPDKS